MSKPKEDWKQKLNSWFHAIVGLGGSTIVLKDQKWLKSFIQKEKKKAGREINKLAKFFLEEYPDEIKEGSAVDNAIRLIKELKKKELEEG